MSDTTDTQSEGNGHTNCPNCGAPMIEDYESRPVCSCDLGCDCAAGLLKRAERAEAHNLEEHRKRIEAERERDEARQMYRAENDNWHSLYDDHEQATERAEQAEAERDEAKRQLRDRINELGEAGFRIERITERAERAERERDEYKAALRNITYQHPCEDVRPPCNCVPHLQMIAREALEASHVPEHGTPDEQAAQRRKRGPSARAMNVNEVLKETQGTDQWIVDSRDSDNKEPGDTDAR